MEEGVALAIPAGTLGKETARGHRNVTAPDARLDPAQGAVGKPRTRRNKAKGSCQDCYDRLGLLGKSYVSLPASFGLFIGL